MDENRKSWLPVAAVIALAVAVGMGVWWTLARPVPAPPRPVVTAQPAPPPAGPAGPEVLHPLPGEPPAVAMAAPAEAPADALAAFERDLAGLADAAAIERFVGLTALVRRAVSTVDNLAGDALPMQARLIRSTGGAFEVRRDGEGFVLEPSNAARYEPFVRAFEALDTRRAVEVYVRHYRLFQGELRGQGSPQRYFNDRLVAAIDHLLATPDVDGAIRLIQPKVQYRFADPALEALSAGQKAMIRMGPQQAARVKAKLRQVRAELTRQPPAAPAGQVR